MQNLLSSIQTQFTVTFYEDGLESENTIPIMELMKLLFKCNQIGRALPLSAFYLDVVNEEDFGLREGETAASVQGFLGLHPTRMTSRCCHMQLHRGCRVQT